MRALLIGPADRENVRQLAAFQPLLNLPLLGKTVAERWVEYLVAKGIKEIFLLAADRPDQVRACVGDGTRWGIRIEVFPEIKELSAAQARLKYKGRGEPEWAAEPHDVYTADHLPGCPEVPLFETCSGWFTAQTKLLSKLTPNDRIGLHEIEPGVWTCLRTRIAPTARLHAPCWIGHNVWIGPDVVIGPNAVIEDKAFLEGISEVRNSVVGRETYVGELTELDHSYAWGNTLLDFSSGSCVKVPDPFLLCSLTRRIKPLGHVSWFARVMAALLLLITLPIGFIAMFAARLQGLPAVSSKIAVRPRPAGDQGPYETLAYYEIPNTFPLLRRWPQLWSIVRGHFSWVGNRPLSPGEASQLTNEYERLWLAAPLGLFSLADAEASWETFNDEVRAHSSFYAVQADWRLNASILMRAVATPVVRQLQSAQILPPARP